MKLSVLVRTLSQTEIAGRELNKKIHRIYIESDLLLESDFLPDFTFFLALPRIYRLSDDSYFERLKPVLIQLINDKKLAGFLIRNFEELFLVRKMLEEMGNEELILVTDYTLYAFNDRSVDFYKDYNVSVTLPLELKKSELADLNTKGAEMMVYGRIPLMVSAGCVQKTVNGCDKKSGFNTLTDRTNTEFLNYKSCIRCENIIFNSLPTSLHKFSGSIDDFEVDLCRLEFTNEDVLQSSQVIDCFYDSFILGKQSELPFGFTKGYFKRGVE